MHFFSPNTIKAEVNEYKLYADIEGTPLVTMTLYHREIDLIAMQDDINKKAMILGCLYDLKHHYSQQDGEDELYQILTYESLKLKNSLIGATRRIDMLHSIKISMGFDM